jgi:hypothetical protein
VTLGYRTATLKSMILVTEHELPQSLDASDYYTKITQLPTVARCPAIQESTIFLFDTTSTICSPIPTSCPLPFNLIPSLSQLRLSADHHRPVNVAPVGWLTTSSTPGNCHLSDLHKKTGCFQIIVPIYRRTAVPGIQGLVFDAATTTAGQNDSLVR